VYGNKTSNVESSVSQEGAQEQFNKEFIKPLPTELEMTRTFTVPGLRYQIEMQAENMHNPDDLATMTWLIECGNPILPADWTMTYEPFLHIQKYFDLTFTVKAEARLPTKPIIRIVPLIGQQRIDNDIYVDNTTLRDGTTHCHF
jgi:hypothetical protein